MKVRLYGSFRHLEEEELAGCEAVVVDVLRATTMLTAALEGGARVEPVASVAAARRRARALGARSLLAGERHGRPIAGFAVGNSPLELEGAALAGRTMVLTTSNGTRAVERCRAAHRVWAAALWNAPAVGRALARGGAPVALVCAGNSAGLALEDLAGAGAVIAALGRSAELSDAARLALELYRAHRARLPALLASSTSGRYLAKIGAVRDIAACAALGRSQVVPLLKRGVFVDARNRP